MPPPDRTARRGAAPAGAAGLDADERAIYNAVVTAQRAYLTAARRALLDDVPAPLTAAAWNLWPDRQLWASLLDKYVTPLLRRIFGRDAPATGPGSDAAIRTAAATTAAMIGFPDRVWEQVMKARGLDPAALAAPAGKPDDGKREREVIAVALDPDAWKAWARTTAITAATATHGAVTAHVQAVAQADGDSVTKTWTTRRDDKVRAAHRAADGDRAGPGEPFIVGGEPLQYPGDPLGSPGNVINCRCRAHVVVRKEGAAVDEFSLAAAATADTALPWAPRDTPWDASAAKKRLADYADGDPAKLARAFVIRDDHANPATLAAYSLPVADVIDGKLTLVWRAVHTAAAAVNGARSAGGMSLPAGELANAKARLTALYQAAAKAFDDSSITAPFTSAGTTHASLKAAAVLDALTAATATLDAPAPAPADEADVAGDNGAGQFGGYFDGAVDVWSPEDFAGTERPPADWFDAPDWLDGPASLPVPDGLEFAPDKPRVVVYPDGRLLGYTACWGNCHTGYADTCVAPPRDATGDYEHFHRMAVRTAGASVRVGKISMVQDVQMPGHAMTQVSASDAAAHYDNVGTTVALARAGEDAHGIWIAGAVVPWADPEQRSLLALSELSGDWRTVAGQPLQMIASLAVNHGGFMASVGAAPAQAADSDAGSVTDRTDPVAAIADIVEPSGGTRRTITAAGALAMMERAGVPDFKALAALAMAYDAVTASGRPADIGTFEAVTILTASGVHPRAALQHTAEAFGLDLDAALAAAGAPTGGAEPGRPCSCEHPVTAAAPAKAAQNAADAADGQDDEEDDDGEVDDLAAAEAELIDAITAAEGFEEPTEAELEAVRRVLEALGEMEDEDDEDDAEVTAAAGAAVTAANWVSKAGGLPSYIKRIAKHLRAKGMDQSHAIATAINVVKKACATSDLNFPGVQHVTAVTKARMCKGVAEWEALKARNAARKASADAEPDNEDTVAASAAAAGDEAADEAGVEVAA